MAKRTEVHFIDDMTGEKADETVAFGLGKAGYAIDLSAVNAKQLRDMFAPYVEAGRRVTGRPQSSRKPGPARTDAEQTRAVRDWARANGYEVANRGRIPQTAQEAFNSAH